MARRWSSVGSLKQITGERNLRQCRIVGRIQPRRSPRPILVVALVVGGLKDELQWNSLRAGAAGNLEDEAPRSRRRRSRW